MKKRVRPRLYFHNSMNKLMLVEGDGKAFFLFLSYNSSPWLRSNRRKGDTFEQLVTDMDIGGYEFLGEI